METLLQQGALSRTQCGRALLSKLKHFRRIGARYNNFAENFLAMVQLASMRVWLRAYESTS